MGENLRSLCRAVRHKTSLDLITIVIPLRLILMPYRAKRIAFSLGYAYQTQSTPDFQAFQRSYLPASHLQKTLPGQLIW